MSEKIVIPRRKPRVAKVGLFGVGYHYYWDQFEGLLAELMGYHGDLKKMLIENGVEVVDFGMVDSAQSAYGKVAEMKAADVDLFFCNMLTYATSAVWGVMARELQEPIVMVALQPRKAMDYDKASTYMQLVNDNVCSVPEFANTAVRVGAKAPELIVGHLYDDAIVKKELAEFCDIAKVMHDLRGARIGHFGHPIEAMLDMHVDQTTLTGAFGLHTVQCEADDLVRLEKTVSSDEVEAKKKEILYMFDTPEPVSDPLTRKLTDEDLHTAATAAVTLDKFIQEFQLDGLAYYYRGAPGSDTARVCSSLIVGNSLLTAAGFPMCGESDLKTCIAMLIMDRLDIGGSFAEFHPADFIDDFILVGHDGPHHINIADGKPVIRSLVKYHGKPGAGASVEFQLKDGPITLLNISGTHNGKMKFIIGEGQSVRGKIPPTGNTNTRGVFKPDVRTFFKDWCKQGPTHHFALGLGHHASTLVKIADMLGIESVVTTPR